MCSGVFMILGELYSENDSVLSKYELKWKDNESIDKRPFVVLPFEIKSTSSVLSHFQILITRRFDFFTFFLSSIDVALARTSL